MWFLRYIHNDRVGDGQMKSNSSAFAQICGMLVPQFKFPNSEAGGLFIESMIVNCTRRSGTAPFHPALEPVCSPPVEGGGLGRDDERV